jgi:hypothetical protein
MAFDVQYQREKLFHTSPVNEVAVVAIGIEEVRGRHATTWEDPS